MGALSASGAAPPDAEATMRLMQQAPQWDHGRKRKELQAALMPHRGFGKGSKKSSWQRSSEWNAGNDDIEQKEEAEDDEDEKCSSMIAYGKSGDKNRKPGKGGK